MTKRYFKFQITVCLNQSPLYLIREILNENRGTFQPRMIQGSEEQLCLNLKINTLKALTNNVNNYVVFAYIV